MNERSAVLVVEDDAMVRNMLCKVLARSGFRTTGCSSGEKALTLARSSCYEAIIIDHYLPLRTGTETTKDLRILCPRSVIIGISGSYEGTCFSEAGGDLFLPKPVDIPCMVQYLQSRLA